MSSQHAKKVESAVHDFPVTVFIPRENESKYLGVFEAASGVLYLRLTGSHTIGKIPNSDLFNSQYGQILCFGPMAEVLAGLMNDSTTGRLNIRIGAKQEVGMNIVPSGEIYLNVSWIVYGFALGDKYYTTKNGEAVVLPLNERTETTEQQGKVAQLNAMLKAKDVVDSSSNGSSTAPSGSRRVRL